jgi:large subunit ribosomal protein L13
LHKGVGFLKACFFFSFYKRKTLTLCLILGNILNGIVCPTRAPETQVYVNWRKKILRTTYMAKAGEVERKWYVVDATDVPLGRLSTVVASVLRGKNKPTFTPHVDTGDFVIVINADKVKLTGKKATDKVYYRHSNHPGGLKSITAGELRAKNSRRLIETSVKGMLPKNTLGRAQGMKLHVYAEGTHPHAAQQPEVLDITNLI